jgi:dephospho-CoA kinase
MSAPVPLPTGKRSVGLTGGIATGKSTVAALLRERGIAVLDADQVSRDLTAPGSPTLAALVDRFGPGVLLPDGSLHRKALGDIIFNDAGARAALNAITHPAIGAAVARWVAAQPSVCVVEATLMVETGSHRRYDDLLVVSCAPALQRARLCAREGIDAAAAEARIAAQAPLAEKEALASEIIWNNDGLDALRAATASAWAALMARPPGAGRPQRAGGARTDQ